MIVKRRRQDGRVPSPAQLAREDGLGPHVEDARRPVRRARTDRGLLAETHALETEACRVPAGARALGRAAGNDPGSLGRDAAARRDRRRGAGVVN